MAKLRNSFVTNKHLARKVNIISRCKRYSNKGKAPLIPLSGGIGAPFLWFLVSWILLFYFFTFPYIAPVQLLTPSVVAMAVRMVTMRLMMFFQVSFFIYLLGF